MGRRVGRQALMTARESSTTVQTKTGVVWSVNDYVRVSNASHCVSLNQKSEGRREGKTYMSGH